MSELWSHPWLVYQKICLQCKHNKHIAHSYMVMSGSFIDIVHFKNRGSSESFTQAKKTIRTTFKNTKQ